MTHSAPCCNGLCLVVCQNNELVHYQEPQRLNDMLQPVIRIINEWFHSRSLPQLETRYSRKVVKDLMNRFPLDENKLQPKVSLDSSKQFSCKLETRTQNLT
jgi:hypothetical protein